MKIITAEQIRQHLKLEDLTLPLENAFKAFSSGLASDAISHLHPNGGEVHIKSGYIRESRFFAIKVSIGFPGNTAKGIPAWDGLVMAFDAETGVPVALVQDGGLLTDWRTAMAGAIATRALARKNTRTVGVVGTGIQAYWQPLAHQELLEFDTLLIWGRNPDHAQALHEKLEPVMPGKTIQICTTLEALFAQSDVVITTTGSREPIIKRPWVRAGTHITAVGADNPEKIELEPELTEHTDLIVVDSRDINAKYGDIAKSNLEPERILELGEVLNQPSLGRSNDQQISLAKLVGLGVQDLAAVATLLERIK